MTDTKETSDLLPCPFCGGAAEQDHNQYYRPLRHDLPLGKAVAIYCLNCSAQMTLCREDHPGVDPEDLMADLVAAWNRRAPTPEAAALILAKEALGKIIPMDRIHGLTPDSGGRQIWHDGECGAVARAALDAIKNLEVK